MVKSVLALFYDSAGGINRMNDLIYLALKRFAEQHEIELSWFCSSDGNPDLVTQAIARVNPDLLITQDIFPNILAAMQGSGIDSFCFSPSLLLQEHYDELVSTFPNIIFFSVDRPGSKTPTVKGIRNYVIPFDAREFEHSARWGSRLGNFCSIGRYHPCKISHELIATRQVHVYADEPSFPKYGDPESPQYMYSKAKALYGFAKSLHRHEGALKSYVDVNLTLASYKYHVLHTKTDCFSLSSAEALLSGAIPIIIANEYPLDPWINWIPAEYRITYSSFDDFEQDIDKLKSQDFNKLSVESRNWIRATHNIPNFCFLLESMLTP